VLCPTYRSRITRVGCKRKLQEEEIFVPARRKKNRRKVVRAVIIREVRMRTSSGDLSIAKSSQSCVVRKRRMINNEQPSSDILA
jgi:hypothetical protein